MSATFPPPSVHQGPYFPDLTGCIDLHMHSTFSDGANPPEFLVDWAAELGLAAIALTDHDNTNGVERALARGAEKGVEIVPACEISVAYTGGTFHLLAFLVDHHDATFVQTLKETVESRNQRNDAMLKALAEHGMPITIEELRAEAGEAVIGRPHMAHIMVRKGYVSHFREAFDKWIGNDGPCFADNVERLTPEAAIKLVLNAGGVPVLAHPRWLKTELNEALYPFLETYIAELVGYGLQGLEVVYPDHDGRMQQHLRMIAQRHNLIITGGSDFHGGTVNTNVTLGHGNGGGFHVPADLLKGLKERKAALMRDESPTRA